MSRWPRILKGRVAGLARRHPLARRGKVRQVAFTAAPPATALLDEMVAAAPAGDPLQLLQQAEAVERRARARLAEAEELAAAMLALARQQAEAIVAAAHAQAVQCERQAAKEGRARGLAAGHAEGLAAARAEAAALVTAAEAEAAAHREQVRAATEAERQAVWSAAKEQLVALSLALATAIVRSEVRLRPEAVTDMAAAALALVQGDPQPTVWAAPADLPALTAGLGRLRAAAPGLTDPRWQPDPDLQRGDVVIASDLGRVDARVLTQIATLAAALQAAADPDEP